MNLCSVSSVVGPQTPMFPRCCRQKPNVDSIVGFEATPPPPPSFFYLHAVKRSLASNPPGSDASVDQHQLEEDAEDQPAPRASILSDCSGRVGGQAGGALWSFQSPCPRLGRMDMRFQQQAKYICESDFYRCHVGLRPSHNLHFQMNSAENSCNVCSPLHVQ